MAIDDGSILRVGAEFDVSNIISGAAQASTAFEGMGAKIAQVSTTAAASASPIDRLAASLKQQGLSAAETQSALVNLGYSEKEAATAAQATTTAANAETVALGGTSTAAEAAGSSMQRLSGGAAMARVELGALSGSTGAAEFGLARLAATSELLAPLISAAFAPLAILAFIEILGRADEAFQKLIDDAVGYTKAVQDFEKENIKASITAEEHAHSVAEAQSNISRTIKEQGDLASETFNEKWVRASENALGATTNLGVALKVLEDPFKLAVPIEKLFTAEGEAADRSVQLSKDLQGNVKDLNALNLEQERYKLALTSTQEETAKAGITDRVQQLQIEIQSLREKQRIEEQIAREEVAAKGGGAQPAQEAVQHVDTDYAAKIKADEKELAAARIDQEQKTAEQVKSIAEAQLAYDEDVTRREYEAHRLSLEQYTEDRRTEAAREIAIVQNELDAEQSAITRRKSLGESVTTEQEALDAKRTVETTKFQQQVYDINAEAAAEEFRLSQESALRRIEIDRTIATAYDEEQTKRAEVAFRAASTVSTIESTGAEYTHARTQAIRDQISAIQEEQAVLNQGPKNQQNELADPAMAQKYAENVAKITTLSQQMESVVTETTEETTRRVHDLQAQQLDTELAAIEEQTRLTEEGVKRQSEETKTSFEDRALSARRYLEEVRSEAGEEYEIQASAIAREMEKVKAAGNARILTEEQVNKKLQELWKQEAQAQQQMLNQMTQAEDLAAKKMQESINKLAQQWSQDWVRMANEVLQGRQKIDVALLQLGRQMEIQLIDKGIQMVVTKTTTYLLQLLASHASYLAQLLGIQTAGQAAQKAKDAAFAVGEIETEAGIAGATAYATALDSAPFPANVAIASAAMGEAIAAVQGNLGFVGAFEKGGVVPATGFGLLHEGEGVLTAQQMMTINNSNSSNTSRTVNNSPVRVTNNFPTNSGNMTPEQIAGHVNKGIRMGRIKVGL